MRTLLIMAALLPAIAVAKEKPPVFVEAKWVKDAPSVTLDPAKAYILLRTSGPVPITFVKVPTPDDQQAYDRLRAAALKESREDYAKKLKRYEDAKAAAAKTSGLSVPAKPIEPTDANFRFTPFAQLASFTIGTANRFAKVGQSVYLHAVTPGTYRLYGQNSPLLGGGVCYCMGSVQFDALAGTITDLGTLAADPGGERTVRGDSSAPPNFAGALTLTPSAAGASVDPRLASLPHAPATLRAAGKMANYWGIAISRLPAIPGVLAYERDRVIDLRRVAAAIGQ